MVAAKKHQALQSSWANKLRIESAACASNEILADQDQIILRALLTEAQLENDTLDLEIPRLQALLDNHKERRSACTERMIRLRMGVAPHKKLPPEILARIFVELMDHGSVDIPLHKLPVPWVVAQVCSKWRMVSRAEPLLWNRLHISALYTYRRKRSVVPLINDFLSNHGGGMVELTIGTLTNVEWRETLACLETHSSRVWRLNLTFSDPIPSTNALSKPLKIFDKLESLALSLRNDNFLTNDAQTFYAFSTARSLLELKIGTTSRLSRNFILNGDMLPWAQLTRLTLSNMTAAPILTFLTHCPSLINLTVVIPSKGSHASSFVVPLRHLHSISITGSAWPNFGEILGALTTPSLKRIVLIYRSYPKNPLCIDPLLIANITTLLERSYCNLNSFQTDFVIRPEDVLTLMRAMPALTKWDVPTQSPIPEFTLSTILEEGLVPNLRIVKGLEVLSIHPVLHFLNSRWSETSPGNYEGIQDSSFSINWRNYSLDDRRYFRNTLPNLQTHGRKIQLLSHY